MLARLSILALILIFDVMVLHAQWSTDPWKGTIISSTPGGQSNPVLTKVKGGNIVVAWSDSRSQDFLSKRDVYAQGVDSNGFVLWKYNGVEVCVANTEQLVQGVVPDAIGGAFVFWKDNRSGVWDIYMQRLDTIGLPIFAKDGIPVVTPAAYRFDFQVISDGFGGTFMIWKEQTNRSTSIIAQHINSDGNILWAPGGVNTGLAFSSSTVLVPIVDGRGGIIVCWSEEMLKGDFRDNAYYSQRIDSAGRIRWDSNSVPICDRDNGILSEGTKVRQMAMTTDDASGAYFAFHDVRYGGQEVFLQHVDSAGTLLLEKDGQLISDISVPNTPNTMMSICPSGTGQVYISSGNTRSVYLFEHRGVLQLFGPDGASLWLEPIPLAQDSIGRGRADIIPDNNGGVIACWLQGPETDVRMYAQRFNSDGSRHWRNDGVFFYSLSIDRTRAAYRSLMSDGSHGAVMAYIDVVGADDLFLKQINSDGVLGVLIRSPPPPIDSNSIESPFIGIRSIFPNPSTGITDIEFVAPVRGPITVAIYNAIGEVVVIPFQEIVQRDISTTVSIDLSAQSSGAFFCRLTGPYINETKMFIVQH